MCISIVNRKKMFWKLSGSFWGMAGVNPGLLDTPASDLVGVAAADVSAHRESALLWDPRVWKTWPLAFQPWYKKERTRVPLRERVCGSCFRTTVRVLYSEDTVLVIFSRVSRFGSEPDSDSSHPPYTYHAAEITDVYHHAQLMNEMGSH
jgi:hypothetical protein